MVLPVQLDWSSKDDACLSVSSDGPGPDITTGVWHHVGFTLTGGIDAPGTATIFVDGTVAGDCGVVCVLVVQPPLTAVCEPYTR